MSVKFSMTGKTPISGASLCRTCKQATFVEGQNKEEFVSCAAGIFPKGIVPFKVASCGDYHPSNMPWLHEMEQMAWIIEARKRGQKGFDLPEGEDKMELVITKPKDHRNDGIRTPPQSRTES